MSCQISTRPIQFIVVHSVSPLVHTQTILGEIPFLYLWNHLKFTFSIVKCTALCVAWIYMNLVFFVACFVVWFVPASAALWQKLPRRRRASRTRFPRPRPTKRSDPRRRKGEISGGNPTGLERRHEKKYEVNHNWLVVWNQQQIGVLMGFNTDLYITIINGIS
jgi:hypothetical protein